MGLFSRAKEKMDERLKKYEVNDDALRTFIGPNADYYIGARDKKIILSWHWPAFFFVIPWLAYRKQYWILLLMVLLGFFPGGGVVVHLAMILVIATYARYFYYSWAYETVGKINQKTDDPEERARLYAKKGGVSKGLAVIFTIFIIAQISWHEYLIWTNQIPNPIAQELSQSDASS